MHLPLGYFMTSSMNMRDPNVKIQLISLVDVPEAISNELFVSCPVLQHKAKFKKMTSE